MLTVSLEDIINNHKYDFLFEFDNEGTTKQFRKDLILLVVGGSHAYGLNTSDSDVDLRGALLEPENVTYGLHSASPIVNNVTDTTLYDLKRFCKLASKANPNILDILYCDFSDILYLTNAGYTLRENRDLFLSKQITKTTLGCVNSNKKRIQKAIDDGNIAKANKYIMHCVRLILAAYKAHKTGVYPVKQDNKELLKIRNSQDVAFFGHWESIINTLEHALKETHDKQSVLPEKADIEAIEKMMIDIYKGEYTNGTN